MTNPPAHLCHECSICCVNTEGTLCNGCIPPTDVSPMPKAEVFFKSVTPYRAWKVENGTTSIEREYATLSRMYQQERAENERLWEALRYEDDMVVWFLDDQNETLKGQVQSWNETYCMIDTPEDRYTVEHEHVFT